MIKPEDIPGSVWEAAKGAIEPYMGQSQYREDCQEDIARAIMAAKAEEREACAKIIDANMLCVNVENAEVLLPRGNPGNDVGFAYAAAIRNRTN